MAAHRGDFAVNRNAGFEYYERPTRQYSVHGNMHGREAKHGADLDGDEKAWPKLRERHISRSAPAMDVTEILL